MAWDLTGIPYGHDVAAIYQMRGIPEDYVSTYYSKDSFMRAYALAVGAMPSEEHWPQSKVVSLQPPKYNRAPERPRKARKKAPYQQQSPSKISKKGATTKCGNCRKMGHNAQGCKAPPNPNRKVYKKKKKNVASRQNE
ncbi:uncharacterized protein LOC114756058 [Neltuma alba]|uniref:uncharacterized protein LOC114756058 n=1 Tax=Neltuma alba TaxID=207710 RepID=UPI0010A2DD4D|nr:uncharacterized protein LOC114756058 [Prosopis alba]